MLAEHKRTGEAVAIKVQKKIIVQNDDDIECIRTEKRVLVLAAGNPFLTKLVCSFQTPVGLLLYCQVDPPGRLVLFRTQANRCCRIIKHSNS